MLGYICSSQWIQVKNFIDFRQCGKSLKKKLNFADILL